MTKGKKTRTGFDNISVVLVEPQSPGNVGSVARAMRNTDFSDLVLVNPCDYRNDAAYSMACKADDVLLGAREYADLRSCLEGYHVSVGATRRLGKLRYPVLTLDEAVPVILDHAVKNKVALVFGREDRGLENTEVPLCDILVEIPTSPDYPSVNLSHAVFTVCHHLFTARSKPEHTIRAARRGEVVNMYAHMEDALQRLGYGSKGGEFLLESILRSFHKLFGRTALMEKEVQMLRGIFTRIEEMVEREEAEEKKPE